MQEFDAALKDREWLDTRSYTIADILLLTTIDFAAGTMAAHPLPHRARRRYGGGPPYFSPG